MPLAPQGKGSERFTMKLLEAAGSEMNDWIVYIAWVGQVTGGRPSDLAGPAQRIEPLPDVKEARADSRDICHVGFRIVDAQGVRVPDAEPELTFTTDGPAKLIGIENGDLNDPCG